MATVKPGFVNHACPAVRTLLADQQADTGADWETNPLTGQPFRSEATQAIDVPLYLRPAIRLAWREIGWDSGSDEAVPQFFLDLGAAAAPHIDIAAISMQTRSFQPRRRTACGCCEGATVGAPAAGGADVAGDAWSQDSSTGLHNYTQTLSFTQPLANDALRVMSGTMESALSCAIDVLADDYTEQPWDELLIARAFVLSPAGHGSGEQAGRDLDSVSSSIASFGILPMCRRGFSQPIGASDPGISLFVPLAGGWRSR